MAPRAFLGSVPSIAGLLLFSSCAAGNAPRAPAPPASPRLEATLLVSGPGAAEPVPAPVHPAEARAASFEVFPALKRQAIAGFGGAFSEKGWEALRPLAPEERKEVLRRIFAPGEGLSLGFGRLPVGSTDYSLSRYALAESPGDLRMERFSIARDEQALIPYVRAAQALNPGLRFFASAFSPPPWMKDNHAFDSGRMQDNAALYGAYALYLAKFVEAYRTLGIPVEAIAVQNEPFAETHYPSCRWEPAQFRTFVRDHLGPTLARRNTGAKVMLGTFNAPGEEAHALAVLQDPSARPFVAALGLQWDGLPIAAPARRIVPGLPVWHTEGDCGNHAWERGFDPERPQNDFAYALETWRRVRRYLYGGAEVYTIRNIVLDETGKSIDAERPWPQNSAVVVDQKTRKVTYTPMFHALEQFSRFAGPGAVLLEGSGTNDALGFLRPDGTIAVELVNPGDVERTMRVKVGGRAWDALLPARSFGTLIVPGA